MAVIALACAEMDDAVAPHCTALTEGQLERLWRLTDVPILCFDGDAAGPQASIRAAGRALPMLAPGRSPAFVTLPPAMDPADPLLHRCAPSFEALLDAAPPPATQLLQHHQTEKRPCRG